MDQHSMFDLLILSLGNACLIGLGIVPNPETNSVKKDLEAAKYNIVLLEMLQDKTKGNLTTAENEMLINLLNDLRAKFVEARR